MDHSRLVDRLLNEIESARAGIAASYAHLWRSDPAPGDGPAPGRADSEQAVSWGRRRSTHEDPDQA